MTETEHLPFPLTIITIFYGFMALMSVFSAGEQYILFSIVLPHNISIAIVVIETAILIFLAVGIFRRSALARSALIGYNIFVIADILITLTFIDKEKLITIIKNSSLLEEYAYINLFFGLIFFIILQYVRTHKEYFNK